MSKKILLLTVLLFSLALAAGCSDATKTNSYNANINDEFFVTEYSEVMLSFSEAIEISDCVAVAEFVSYKDNKEYVEYEFKVNEILRGEILEKTINLFEMKGSSSVEEIDYTYEIGKDVYNVGDEYILIMEKNDSLFYDYPHYVLVTNIYIPIKEINKGTMYDKQILDITANIETVDDIKLLISKTKKADKDVTESNYTKSNNMSTVIVESDLILEVKIKEMMVEGILHNGNTYYCDVLNILKGDSIVTIENRDDILITLMKDSVEIGETYIIMVNRVGEESAIYTQSSISSIISLKDTKMLNEIKNSILSK